MDLLWCGTRILWGPLDSQGEKQEQTEEEPASKKGAHGRGMVGGGVERRDVIKVRWWAPQRMEDGAMPGRAVCQDVRGGGRLND